MYMCTQWSVILKKTKKMYTAFTSVLVIVYDMQPLQWVNNFKYLGVTFSGSVVSLKG